MYGAIVAVLLALEPPSAAPACPEGVVVEEVGAGFVAAQAGLRAGDVLCGWTRAAAPPANPEPASGTLTAPFDLLLLDQEQAPRGIVTFAVLRDGARLSVTFPPGRNWRLKVRPRLHDAELDAYESARSLVGTPRRDEGLSRWRELAARWSRAGEHRKASWLFHAIARVAAEAQQWSAVDAALADAVQEASSAHDEPAVACLHVFRGWYLEDRSDLEAAAVGHAAAVAAYRSLGTHELGEAMALEQLAIVALSRGQLAVSQEHQEAALSIRERAAPGSTDVASSLNNLGVVARQRGDLVRAEEYYRRSLAIGEAIEPVSLDVATNLNNLGGVASLRGDLVAAEDLHRRSLALRETLVPDSLDVAMSLTNLGINARKRRDWPAAVDYSRRALAIKERRAPESLALALSINVLGFIAYSQGDWTTAARDFERALALREKLAPDSVDVAESLANCGLVAVARGELDRAETYFRRALAVVEKVAPDSLDVAQNLHALGDVARLRKQHEAAEEYYRRALAIRRERAPGSEVEAKTCHAVALVQRERGQLEQALDSHRCALDALEAQRSRLGGSDAVRSGFAADFASYYHETIAAYVAAGRAAEAFHVLERYRARELLALLAERDLVFSADVPEELDRERRMLNAEYDRALGRLAEAKGGETAQPRAELVRLRERRSQIQQKIRAASPRLAALHDPEPLALSAAQAALDPGTLLLSYAIGERASYLFVLGPGPNDFAAALLETDRERLRGAVGRFRELLREPETLRRKQLDRVAAELAGVLLAPAADSIARAERVVVVPDGPLHLVPFAVLPVPGGGGKYLLESKPVHVVGSATVFAEIKKTRRAARAWRVAAFGDPDYSAASAEDRTAVDLRSARKRGLALRPLPASRGEVEGLRRLFPQSPRVFVGADANEANAKRVGRDVSLIHFACHALADEAAPLDSALALSLPRAWKPGQHNGLLQAWEIFEQVRIDAEIVTLSACGTALGHEMSGEGIVGLTRAFQYAGARSVLASLWAVDDDSTAQLMQDFYRHLGRGESKDAALRAAQLEMMRRVRSSHPAHWAAFQLIGDWR
jgi:CHAT domain-containing protein/Tfp pilus assembly protein PilF